MRRGIYHILYSTHPSPQVTPSLLGKAYIDVILTENSEACCGKGGTILGRRDSLWLLALWHFENFCWDEAGTKSKKRKKKENTKERKSKRKVAKEKTKREKE
ncbi:MAG: hypothetical protein J6A96_01510 [Clostridia bacterium]|nr:hypothetical protein [Clostridia bacterium]